MRVERLGSAESGVPVVRGCACSGSGGQTPLHRGPVVLSMRIYLSLTEVDLQRSLGSQMVAVEERQQ